MIFNPEVAAGWIGLRTHDGGVVRELLDSGVTSVVFRVSYGSKERVIFIPQGHLGLLIDVPPLDIFLLPSSRRVGENIIVFDERELSDYYRRLQSYLHFLVGAPALADLYPLNAAWQCFAVRALNVFGEPSRLGWGDIDPTERALLASDFVITRLRVLATSPDGSADDPFTVIMSHEKQIHCDSAENIRADAQRALVGISKHADSSPSLSNVFAIHENPYLPFLVAFSSGYSVDDSSIDFVCSILDSGRDPAVIPQQLGRVLREITRLLDGSMRMTIVEFVFRSWTAAVNTKLSDLELLMSEVLGRR